MAGIGKRIAVEVPLDVHEKLEAEKARSGAPIRFQVIRALEAYLASNSNGGADAVANSPVGEDEF